MGDADGQLEAGKKLPSRADYFAALGVPRRFDLSHAQISRAYLAASRAWQGEADDERRQQALDVVNQAKMTLLHAESRAGHLLGIEARGEKLDAAAERGLPDGFLMVMMEKREELAAAQERGDVAAIEAFGVWARGQRDGYAAEVTPLFARLSQAQAGSSERRAAAGEIRKILNAWRYIERMMEQLQPEGPAADGL